MGRNDDDDGFPATQPVRSLLLEDIVAYVEVRSGHDNRSRGVKAQLRTLGARVVDTLTKDVTHVVFNEGLPSTYRKARKMKCHLVSVLWIEACKEELTKVCEAGYPPIGQQLYEDPKCLKNFKKLKSMQPDFDEEVAIMKTNAVRKRMQRRKPKSTDCNNEVNLSSTDSHQKPASKKTSKKSSSPKTTEKKVALKEITPIVINKPAMPAEIHVQNSAAVAEEKSTTEDNFLQRTESSTSVIFCGELQAETSSDTNRRKKKSSSSKASTDKDISRHEFVEGLSTVLHSLSENKQKWMPNEISPWRKRLNKTHTNMLPPKAIPPKNPVKNVMPRRSPRQSAVQIKSIGVSASAALYQKHRLPQPKSPGEEFMLLSQEPGDMPSVDELARMKKGSINIGGSPVSLSQVIRSYNAVAEGNLKSTAQPQVSDIDSQRSSREEPDSEQRNFMYVDEDALCDEEIVQHCENTCPSDAGSTVSSTSTKVLVNGMAPECCGMSPCNALTGSEEVAIEKDSVTGSLTVPSTLANEVEEKCDRDPSPVFIIKKAKLRRPIKKVVSTIQKDGCPSTSSSTCTINGAGNRLQDPQQESEARDDSTSDRGTIKPIDYLNKIFLPRFMSTSVTPHNNQNNTVYVEETPDSVPNVSSQQDPIIIPPTPAVQCDRSNSIVLPTQSFTTSVFSWVKKSCKVPLFSSQPKKLLETPNSRPTNSMCIEKTVSEQTVSVTTMNKHASVIDDRQARSDKIIKSQESALKTQDSEDPVVCSETQYSVRKSTRKQQNSSHLISSRPKGNKKTEDNSNLNFYCTPNTPLENYLEGSDVSRSHTRSRVDCVDEVNSCDTSNKSGEEIRITSKESPVCSENKLKESSSSGYDTSISIVSITKKSRQVKKNVDTLSSKRKRISEMISPIPGPGKKRSEIYETSTTSATPTLDKTEESDTTSKTSVKKRTKSTPNANSKRVKLNSSESSLKTKTTRTSRADSSNLHVTRSHSDLSTESSKSFGRKSSEVAKKRLAKSLSRVCANGTPKVIVCTFLTTSEQNGIDIAGESLSGWKLEDKVTVRTTHVINSGPKRTLNMLKGMARGCWLVDQKWMLDSSKSGEWLDEEKYELSKFSPAVKQCRLKRQAMGREFKHNLFAKVGAIYVSPKTENPPAKDVREILELCGAKLTSSYKEANIVIGVNMGHKGSFHCVNARWVLDSVTKNKILSVNDLNFQIE